MSADARGARLAPPVTDSDHILGPESAPVTLVEYGDYQCPFCGEFQRILERLIDQLGDRFRFCFRNFPLPQHVYAQVSAEAAEAAASQRKFWPMHDLLFHRQDALDPGHLLEYARSLELDVATFDRDVREHRFLGRIREDIDNGELSGVEGTPTVFINEILYDGPLDLPDLVNTIEWAAG